MEEHIHLGHNWYQFDMPVCYLLNLNHGKFKGNNMHYFVDNNDTRYCDIYPVFCDQLKFKDTSKYHQEKRRVLKDFLEELDVPEFHILTSKEKQMLHQQYTKQRNAGRSEGRHKDVDSFCCKKPTRATKYT